ncbi:hypothetical protein PMES_03221 [Profundibacterium mesophilum KAUST100406-0324]|uniref:Uncharacterized protein n=1 Tax=Profundibacterium mesophilum KAUST100406-0324 TaxID=1037889 RepID=A0A921TDM2_9RHOB|nr:hypothetical protein PMES_03221 [Profundibacterium mesophilum KAUST100406-0324]
MLLTQAIRKSRFLHGRFAGCDWPSTLLTYQPAQSSRLARAFVHRLSFARGDPWTPAPLPRRQGDAPLSLTLSGPSAGARVIVPHSPLHPPARRGPFATPPAPLRRLRRPDTPTPRILRDARRWGVGGEQSALEDLPSAPTTGESWLIARAPAARNQTQYPAPTRPSPGGEGRLGAGCSVREKAPSPRSAQTSAMRRKRTLHRPMVAPNQLSRPALAAIRERGAECPLRSMSCLLNCQLKFRNLICKFTGLQVIQAGNSGIPIEESLDGILG